MTAPRLRGRTALVTGASGGLGRCFAEQLAARGANLVLTGRREDVLRALAAEVESRYGVAVTVVPLDLALPAAAERLFDAMEGAGVVIDVLVNNAGTALLDRFAAAPLATAQEILAVNVSALTELCWLFGRAMQARGQGYILNVASAAAFVPAPNMAVYGASKAYIRSFSDAIAHELRPGVRITSVCPSGMATGFWANAAPGGVAGMTTGGNERPEDVARAALRALFAGRRGVVPGMKNRLNEALTRVLPRRFLVHMTGRVLSRGLPPERRP